MLLKYIGTAHFRELLEDDLEKLGAMGHNALMFAKDEVTEVAHEVYEAIMTNLADEFEAIENFTGLELPFDYPGDTDPEE